MSSDAWASILSAFIGFVGLLLVAIQMRRSTKQGYLQTLYQATDVNRQLVGLGFSNPELFKILLDGKTVDPMSERFYLQLWLNQLSMIHSCLKHGAFDAEFQDSLERSIADFMTLQNMQRHWQRFHEFYPPSFQELVNEILSKASTAIGS